MMWNLILKLRTSLSSLRQHGQGEGFRLSVLAGTLSLSRLQQLLTFESFLVCRVTDLQALGLRGPPSPIVQMKGGKWTD